MRTKQMVTKLKKITENIKVFFIILCFVGIVLGIGYIKHNIWRAEHPQAKNWTFFIPKSK